MAAPKIFQTGQQIVTSGLNGLIAIDLGSPDVASFKANSGTVTLNGVTPITVTNANVGPNSLILYSLKTVGGTVGAQPATQTVTPGTGFTVAGTALDTSTYVYSILG